MSDDTIAGIGMFALVLLWAFVILVAILWIVMPFIVHNISARLKRMHDDTWNMQKAMLEKLDSIDRSLSNKPPKTTEPTKYRVMGVSQGTKTFLTVKAASQEAAGEIARKRGIDVRSIQPA